jgi:hypothetical protein
MNIEIRRINAMNCWKLASRFSDLSPAGREFAAGLFGANPEKRRKSVADSFIYWILSRRCDTLILVDDASVRVKILRAMSIMGYLSKHIGFIATLCNSNEKGGLLLSEKESSHAYLRDEARSYLYEILKTPESIFAEWGSKVKHWQGVLDHDYSKEFATEHRLDFSGDKPKYVSRNLSAEEVAKKVRANKEHSQSLYQQDIREYLQGILDGSFKKTKRQAYVGLENILKYIFEAHENIEDVAVVLELLQSMARRGDFPSTWLINMTTKYANSGKLTKSLKSLIIEV